MLRYTLLLMIGVIAAGMPRPVSGQSSTALARGARLWNATCNRCHNRRSPTERTDAQWDVIASHMRTRANLTKSEVNALIEFLQQANGDTDPRDQQAPDTSSSAAAVPVDTPSSDSQGIVGPSQDLQTSSLGVFGSSRLRQGHVSPWRQGTSSRPGFPVPQTPSRGIRPEAVPSVGSHRLGMAPLADDIHVISLDR